jgi:hypothetical protein
MHQIPAHLLKDCVQISRGNCGQGVCVSIFLHLSISARYAYLLHHTYFITHLFLYDSIKVIAPEGLVEAGGRFSASILPWFWRFFLRVYAVGQYQMIRSLHTGLVSLPSESANSV